MTDTHKIKYAVLVSLDEDADGIRLSLDDVLQQHGTTPAMWKQDRNVTSKVYSQDILKDLRLTEKEFADIAYYILARLNALKKVWEINE